MYKGGTNQNIFSTTNCAIYINGTKLIYLYNAQSQVFDTTYTPTNDVWTHLVATYNGTTNVINIYINGSLYKSNNGITYSGDSAGNLCIGKYPGGTGWGGYLDNARYYNYDLTAAQVLTLYNYENSYPMSYE